MVQGPVKSLNSILTHTRDILFQHRPNILFQHLTLLEKKRGFSN
jgi:hypothetical protein